MKSNGKENASAMGKVIEIEIRKVLIKKNAFETKKVIEIEIRKALIQKKF